MVAHFLTPFLLPTLKVGRTHSEPVCAQRRQRTGSTPFSQRTLLLRQDRQAAILEARCSLSGDALWGPLVWPFWLWLGERAVTRERSGVRAEELPLALALVEFIGGDCCSGLTVTESAEALGRSIGRGCGSGASDNEIRGEEVRAEARRRRWIVMGKTNREKFQGCTRVDVEPGQGRQAASPDYGLGSPSCLVIESNRLITAGGWGLSQTMLGGQMDHEAEQEQQLQQR